VDPAVRQTLATVFSFDRRDLTQPVYQSEVIAAIQAVPGVDYLDLDLFATAELPRPATPEPPPPFLQAATASGTAEACLPAELILVGDNPTFVQLQEIT
jgi:hypothetical protein